MRIRFEFLLRFFTKGLIFCMTYLRLSVRFDLRCACHSTTLHCCPSLLCLYLLRAADEYIVRHFAKYVHSDGVNLSVLRVYDPDRRVSTVNDTVKSFCLQSADATCFVAPSRSDILHHNVIVTTLVTSLMLTKLSVKGHFTHIFIDEAAQVCFCLK